ncbi:hypothetical protein IJ182_10565 [bacterium]|nr:hypothetical protein [bacterium]
MEKSITFLKNKKRYLFYIILFLFTFWIFEDSILCADDIYCNFFPIESMPLNVSLNYGALGMHLQYILLYYIPYHLNINIQDWALSFGVLLKSIFIVLFIFYLEKIQKDLNLNSYIKLFSCLVVYLVFFLLSKRLDYVDFYIAEGFFRFLMPAFLFSIFIYYIKKLFIDNKYNYLFLCAFPCIMSFSSELIAGISLIFILFIIVYKVIDKKNITINELTPYIIVLISIIIGTLFLTFSDGFRAHFSDKLGESCSILSNLRSYISTYSIVYIKKLFEGFLYFLLMIVLIILSYIVNRNNNTSKYIFLAVSILISTMLIQYMLVIMGITPYGDYFWIEHRDLYSIFYIAYLLAFFIICSCFIAQINKKYTKQIIIFFILIIMMLMPLFVRDIKYLKTHLYLIKCHGYIRDKIFAFVAYSGNKDVSFPKLMNDLTPCIDSEDIDGVINADALPPAPGIDYLSTQYYFVVYKIKKDFLIKRSDLNNKKYIENLSKEGFTYDEVYANKIIFNKLSDKNFVLNIK